MTTRGFTGRQPPPNVTGRIPPGQSETHDFPVLSAGPTPRIRTEVAAGLIRRERYGG